MDAVEVVRNWASEVEKAKENQDKELGETGEEWEKAWDDVKVGELPVHDRARHVGLGF